MLGFFFDLILVDFSYKKLTLPLIVIFCKVYYDYSYYSTSTSTDPIGPRSEPKSPRVARGGYFRYFTRHSRSASRNARNPDARHRVIGARLVKEIK